MKSTMVIGFGLIRATAAALGIACLAIAAHAQEFPNRTGRMIVPYPPGGTTDVLARRIAEALKAKLGQTWVVENKAGAQTQLGVQDLLRAPADGHTLLMATATTMSLNPVLIPNLTYKIDQLAPVALVAKVPFALDASLKFPPNTMAEARARMPACPSCVSRRSIR